MELVDYLEGFLRGLGEGDRKFTAHLEVEASDIQSIILETLDKPSEIDLQRAKRFLLDVEKWKADCMEEMTGNAARNAMNQIWEALRGAITASSDLDALLSTMNLIGFGSSRDEETGQRRAKRATAVLRFLNPGQWGVVDWRTIAILSFYRKNGFDIDSAVQEARKWDRGEVAALFDLIDEKTAITIVQEYRGMREKKLPRTGDVELALYGASFLAWPRPSRVKYRRH